MSADAMDIDPVSQSPERKRKHKDKDHHSSKKHKHLESSSAPAETSSKGKRKEKSKKHKHSEAPEPASTLPDTPNARSKTKHHKKSHAHAHDSDNEPTQSPSTSRKPLTKSSSTTTAQPSQPSSPFHLITSTLYLPLSPISISPTQALPSLLAEHLSPLLLTYYPPFHGIVLAYSNASISSSPPRGSQTHPDRPNTNPQPLTLATSAGEYGVLYVYLTATFLIFRPERGQELEGWVNVQSDGFLGAVVHNLFSVGIERKRLPADWRWVAPGEETEDNNATANAKTTTDDEDEDEDEDPDTPIDPDQEHFKPLPASASAALDLGLGLSNHNSNNKAADPFADTADAATGYFATGSGKKVRGTIRFRVRDVDVIPGAEADKGFLSIEGTMLSPEEEAGVVGEERRRAGYGSGSGRDQGVVMSGGVGAEAEEEEVVEVEAPAPVKKSKEKKKKSKKGTL
ncbi:hypothetical protein FQN50_009394 [Emmonsiellopsis sp. PD_5]|nr:hypothetical protein FQN50_009394 [Emmonsiellopsis sp. PD_5]